MTSLLEIPSVKTVLQTLQKHCRCGKQIPYKLTPELGKDGVLTITVKFANELEQRICKQSGAAYCSLACHDAWHALPEIKAAEAEKAKWGQAMVTMTTAIYDSVNKGENNLALKMCHDFMRGPFAKVAAASKVMGSQDSEQQKKVTADMLTNIAALRKRGATCEDDLRYRYDELGHCVDFFAYAAEKMRLTWSSDVA